MRLLSADGDERSGEEPELRSLTAALFEDEQVETIECESAEAALATLLIGGREQPPVPVSAAVNLSSPNGHATLFHGRTATNVRSRNHSRNENPARRSTWRGLGNPLAKERNS